MASTAGTTASASCNRVSITRAADPVRPPGRGRPIPGAASASSPGDPDNARIARSSVTNTPLNPILFRSVIRNRIGFRGVLVTDDLAMRALSGSPGELAPAAAGIGRPRPGGRTGSAARVIDTLLQLALAVVPAVLAITLHEAAHGYA